MDCVSEATQTTIIGPHVRGVETETFLLLSKISEEKELLKTILNKYNARSPVAIEKMIEQGKINEHPAYEDYLSALSYEQNIKDLKKILDPTFRTLSIFRNLFLPIAIISEPQ